ncbi:MULTISPECIES: 30S ribosome-binding factor RbfA [unclassified Desulfurobacterium]|uniref:30S ribosome-binding factor RbfA n=1 Tax=unclassified Desulfurobacterium TaxID=2639089 RepID=UPI0003B61C5A|nr:MULTISPECIES: 30S ribosome-binding factor RbfA [unclassified Desulfurobacterium]
MKNRRKERIESLLRREISDIITFEIDKPEGVSFVSVFSVDVSKDGRKAVVYISALKSEEAAVMVNVLNHAAGYIHHLLGKRLRMKVVPRPEFKVAPDIMLGDVR